MIDFEIAARTLGSLLLLFVGYMLIEEYLRKRKDERR